MDIVVEIITFTLLLLLFIYTFQSYSDLSQSIPVHFNASGVADAYGDKSSIWILPVLGLVLALGMLALSRFPHIHNYMVNITEENAYKNYQLSSRILRWVNLAVVILFGFIQVTVIQKGLGNDFSLGKWFVPLIVGSTLTLPVFIFIYSQKINKK